MRVLEYRGLDVSAVRPQYEKIRRLLEQEDFRAAQVKRLGANGLYRAKLDDANRLLFRLMRWQGERCALILEVILGHAYERSRFLRGSKIDEAKIPDLEATVEPAGRLPELPYLNPANPRFHLLDKVLSFDERQEEIFRTPPPLIIIGPAGSGKTALTLEKLRQAEGRVLYVTLSPYLAEHARNLYWAHHYENEQQEVSFLSFAELLETLCVPEGRPVSFREFSRWFLRFPKALRPADAHAVYEEFRGVITGFPTESAFLAADEYLALGVRQSLFPAGERPAVYVLFEKYLGFLKEQRLYDPNVISHQYLGLVRPAFDLVVADEVQDITNIQLRLILGSLKESGQFILCGDTNQIVHPNFFSWASLKGMLYREEREGPERVYRILHANFRNAASVTALANRLLRIKHRRFGSVDRESTYLMECMPGEPGEVVLLEDTEAVKADLNRRTAQSTRFAVIVMREEDKDAVRAFFRTPLLFSVHEAKGLEYESVILVNFISGQRAQFEEIARGIDAADLDADLEYRRAKDKADKSLELYKFYVNALYVAITRAIRRVYIIESDARHPMARLLGFGAATSAASVAAERSSREEWAAEARKLELQGKQEQAEEIRQRVLQVTPVPWEVLDTERILALLDRALDPREVSQKPRKALLEYALYANETGLVEALHRVGFAPAAAYFPGQPGGGARRRYRIDRGLFAEHHRVAVGRAIKPYLAANVKGVLGDCERHGVDHRSPANRTPLMLAAAVGNMKLVRALLEAGADRLAVDNYGHTAWHMTLGVAMGGKNYAPLAEFQELIVPPALDLRVDDRLVKIDSHAGEFLLFAAFQIKLDFLPAAGTPGLTAIHLEEALGGLPESVVPAYRKKRSYISSLLAKNEVESAQPYNRKLFRRVRHGHYILNPAVQVRRGEEWIGVPELLNLRPLARILPAKTTRVIELHRGAPVPSPRPSAPPRTVGPRQEVLPLFPTPPATSNGVSEPAQRPAEPSADTSVAPEGDPLK